MKGASMDYPGKGIYMVTVEGNKQEKCKVCKATITSHNVIKHIWLVVAKSDKDALAKFRLLNRRETKEGAPLFFEDDKISSEPLEFERGVSQMW